MDLNNIVLLLVLGIGFYLAFNIGANDVANAMGTSVGSKALSIKNAIIVAAIFEFLGAVLIGDEVSKTIKKGFVDPVIFAEDPIGFAYGMSAAILATAIWLQYATLRGFPVSTTHSIVGAVLGFAIVHGDLQHIDFSQLFSIFTTWIISPIFGGIVSYLCLLFILKVLIDSYEPLKRALYVTPVLVFFSMGILSTSFTFKIAHQFFGANTIWLGLGFSILLALSLAVFFFVTISKINLKLKSRRVVLEELEKIFIKLQIITACFLAFAHGSNDVANAIGPAAAVINAVLDGKVNQENAIPLWLLLIGALGIVFGLLVFGKKVIDTVGKKITEMTPSRGFSAEFGASLTILMGSKLGIPLSTTHVLVGSVIGVGLARGISGINSLVIKRIWKSWLITIPATMVLSSVFCLVINLLRN